MGSGQTRYEDDVGWCKPAQAKRPKVEATLIYTVQVTFKHGQVICQLLDKDQNQSPCERIIPIGWELDHTQNHPGMSFADFVILDGPPKQEDIDEIVRKIELLDAAVEAMLAK